MMIGKLLPVLLLVLYASVLVLPGQCQVEDVDDFGDQLHHPDRDVEHVPAPSSKEIITNHIVTDHSDGEGMGVGDSHYQDGENGVDGPGGRYTEIGGDVVLGEKILRASESPYSMRTDLEVERRARLIIEAGVTIHFAPMVGITVRGSVVAMVRADQPFNTTLFLCYLICLSLTESWTAGTLGYVGSSYTRLVAFGEAVEQCLINSTCFVYLFRLRSLGCFLNSERVIRDFTHKHVRFF